MLKYLRANLCFSIQSPRHASFQMPSKMLGAFEFLFIDFLDIWFNSDNRDKFSLALDLRKSRSSKRTADNIFFNGYCHIHYFATKPDLNGHKIKTTYLMAITVLLIK